MERKDVILSCDVGTTTLRVVAFDKKTMDIIDVCDVSLEKSIYGLKVEQNPYDYIDNLYLLLNKIIKKNEIEVSSSCLCITNQRETTILWDKQTGEAVHSAIVWEDKRTQEWCDKQSQELKDLILEKTWLPLIPYFSASKIRWILDNEQDARILLRESRLMFGTVDSWIIWNLTDKSEHITDHTNASRTLLYNPEIKNWDEKLLNIFDIDINILPKIQDSKSNFGFVKKSLLGYPIPIVAVCADQQSSMLAALSALDKEDGATKITFGTGTFIMQITDQYKEKHDNFFNTIAIGKNGRDIVRAQEAKIEKGGKLVEPILNKPIELSKFMHELAFEVVNLVSLLPSKPEKIIVDGGVSQNDELLRLLEIGIGCKIQRLSTHNGTALGVALLARLS